MKWTQSLIRIADHEIDALRLRVAEVTNRRTDLEAAQARLDQEAEMEAASAAADAEAGWYLIGFRDGWRLRKARVDADLAACALEEAGARDALSAAFEARKKVEMVQERHAATLKKLEGARDAAALDEIALRRAVAG